MIPNWVFYSRPRAWLRKALNALGDWNEAVCNHMVGALSYTLRRFGVLGAGGLLALSLAFGLGAASGAGILFQATFRASGTGAVDRSAMSKLRDVVSVKDFGAKGDGATDDTVAIQAAINSTGTGASRQLTVYLPDGTYVLSNTISIPEGVELTGGGAWKAKLEWGSFAGIAIQWTNGSPNDYPQIMRNFAMHSTGVGIDTAATSGAMIDNIWFTNGTAIQIPGTADITIHHCVFDGGSEGVKFTASSQMNNIDIVDNDFSGLPFPIQIQNARDIHILGNTFRAYTSIGIFSPSSSNTLTNIVIANNTFYNSSVGGSIAMKLTGTITGLTMVNNLIDGTGGEAVLCDAGTITDWLLSDNQFKNTTGNTLSWSGSCVPDKVMVSHNVWFSGIQKAAAFWRGAGQFIFGGNTIFNANASGQTLLNGAAVDVDSATLFYARANLINTSAPTYGFLLRSAITVTDANDNSITGPTISNYLLAGTTQSGMTMTGKTSLYNNITTAGYGQTAIHGTPVLLTAKTADLAATNVYAAAPVGEYRVCATARTTTSGTGTTANLNIIWTDEGGVKTDAVGTWALNSVTVTGQINKCEYIHAAAASNIQVSVTAGTYGTSVYAISATAERLN